MVLCKPLIFCQLHIRAGFMSHRVHFTTEQCKFKIPQIRGSVISRGRSTVLMENTTNKKPASVAIRFCNENRF